MKNEIKYYEIFKIIKKNEELDRIFTGVKFKDKEKAMNYCKEKSLTAEFATVYIYREVTKVITEFASYHYLSSIEAFFAIMEHLNNSIRLKYKLDAGFQVFEGCKYRIYKDIYRSENYIFKVTSYNYWSDDRTPYEETVVEEKEFSEFISKCIDFMYMFKEGKNEK